MRINFLLNLRLITLSGILFLVLYSATLCFSQDKTISKERFVEITEARGEVQVQVAAEAGWKLAKRGMRIQQEAEIRTGNDSKAVISIDEDASSGKVDIFSNSLLRIGFLGFAKKQSAKWTLLELGKGQILVEVKNLTADDSFQVQTPTSKTIVKGEGAVFEVNVEEE